MYVCILVETESARGEDDTSMETGGGARCMDDGWMQGHMPPGMRPTLIHH